MRHRAPRLTIARQNFFRARVSELKPADANDDLFLRAT
jgi:hypothetical protein